jgi:hypothetical protein
MLTWKQIDQAIDWKTKKSTYGRWHGTDQATDTIKIPIINIDPATGKIKWKAPGFRLRSGGTRRPTVIIDKTYSYSEKKWYGGQYFGYGILPNIKTHNDYKKLLQAYIDKDFDKMMEMLTTDNYKIIRSIFES